jgi:glyoxylase-like metal-dependent hydrolase (beta-lactamase superfamily II)
MIISFQCFVLRSKGRTAMIDTCIGNDRKREFEVFCNMQNSFLEDLSGAGFPAEQVTDVLCTHLHFDHVGWNTRLVDGKWVPTFPQARYLFGRREWEHWKHLRETNGYHHMDHLQDSIDPILAAGLEEFIDADFRLTDEVSLIATPGHTPGHVSVLIESRGERAVITGDLMHSPIQIAIPATEGRFDMDKPLAARTRCDFVQRFCDTGTLVIGSHFPEPTAGHIVADGNAWKLTV